VAIPHLEKDLKAASKVTSSVNAQQMPTTKRRRRMLKSQTRKAQFHQLLKRRKR